MPTGYTAEVGEGKVTDFRTFALRCARQFGACIMQREDPMSDTPKHREASAHYSNSLEAARASLASLNAMTLAEANRAAEAEHQKALDDHREREKDRAVTRQRYDAMLVEVELWTPPSADHEEMKRFMRDQLLESIKWDCGSYGDDPALLGGAEWLEKAQKSARQNIAYFAKADAEERARVDSSNQWIDALYASLNATAIAGGAS